MLDYTFILLRKINILSKITYLLFLGTFLAVGAITYNIYQPLNIEEKKINVPVVDKIKEAKPVIKNDEKLKKNQDLGRFIENITVIEKDLISIFEKNLSLLET